SAAMPVPPYASGTTSFNFFTYTTPHPSTANGIVGTGSVTAKTGHFSADPTVVSHCPFCGTGGIVGRSDGTIECTICTKAFVVMEQPLHTFMPSKDPGAAIKSDGQDPLAGEDAFHDPESASPPP